MKILQKRKLKLASVFQLGLILLTFSFSSQQSLAQGIEWQVAPYLWTFDTTIDLTVNNDPVLGIDLPFKDVVDKLDGAFMGYVEGHGENFGVFADIAVVNLTDSNVTAVGPGGPIVGDLIVDSDLELNLYELGGFYRIGNPETVAATFDLLLGARIVDVNQAIGITLPGPGAGQIQRSIDVSETDIFIGGRVSGKISERWTYKARVDMGGGGTEGTLNMMATVGYTFGKTGLFSLDFGYKYMNIDLETNDGETYLETEMNLSGPLIGFVFNF